MGSVSAGISDATVEPNRKFDSRCDVAALAATLAERLPPAELMAQIERLREDRRSKKRLLEASERALTIQAERGWKAREQVDGSAGQAEAGTRLVASPREGRSAATAKSDGDPSRSASSDDSAPSPAWMAAIPNDPIEIGDFMANFCEQKTKGYRVSCKKKLLAAGRNKTVKMPALAFPARHGQPNRYFTHDLLRAWQGFLDNGVDLPRLTASNPGG